MPFSTYQRARLGHAVIEPAGPFVAGSLQHLVITYTAGPFCIDDTGALKISWRTASDAAKPQTNDPKAANFVSATASNGAGLSIEYNRNNIRPWVNTLLVRATGGFLRVGDTISVRLRDPAGGCPGYRLQTAAERPFPFKVFVDAFATYDFVELEESPAVDLVPGPARRFKAILPTLRRTGDRFRLAVLAEDRWGNPTDEAKGTFHLKCDAPIDGLPETITLGDGPAVVDGLSSDQAADLRVEVTDEDGRPCATSNPLRIADDASLLHYWGDLHGQSGETVGAGTARDYFAFARDRAFLDITGHQGNDFQIDDAFWAEINRLAAEFDDPGRFTAFPSYEWSGNTGMGGDRNVFYCQQDRPIYRSSSVLLESPHDTDRHHVKDLFESLADEEAFVIAHVGGRYADLGVGHDGRIERAVEIHSCWGTFEWLLHDALALGHRVGIVCHSDDHKGRPGAAWPGAGTFGAIGGLTCYLMERLDREAVFECIRNRRTFGTTGARIHVDLQASFDDGCERFLEDPALLPPSEPASSEKQRTATMGAIVRTRSTEAEITVEVLGSAPIERLTFFDGPKAVATVRAYDKAQLGRRIRILFEGAVYRGRGREVVWRGSVRLKGARFFDVRPINLFRADKPLVLADDGTRVDFDTVTTGNFCGFDLWLEERERGEIEIASNVIERHIKIADISLEDMVLDAGGLGRRMRLFRLPNENTRMRVHETVRLPLEQGRDHALYVRVTQEDGHQAWTSPLYVID